MKRILVLTLLYSAPAAAEPWVDQLYNSRATPEQCCANSDGRRLDDPEWDTLGEVTDTLSGYRVLDGGAWKAVPKDALVEGKNLDGIVRVWFNKVMVNSVYVNSTIRCFLRGALE